MALPPDQEAVGEEMSEEQLWQHNTSYLYWTAGDLQQLWEAVDREETDNEDILYDPAEAKRDLEIWLLNQQPHVRKCYNCLRWIEFEDFSEALGVCTCGVAFRDLGTA